MPSAAAVEEYIRNSGVRMTDKEIASRKKDVAALIIPAWVHQKCSETYGGRNSKAQVAKDAKDLKGAVDRNMEAIRGCLREEGFSDAEIDEAHQDMHQINIKMGLYK
jgi:hypothetical protein